MPELSEEWRKGLLLFACFVFLIFLLSFLEPGYQQICNQTANGTPPNCASYNVIAYFFWRFIGVTNEYGPAIGGLATIFIAVFTWTLWRTSETQSALTSATLKLARDEFNATHRPWISVSWKPTSDFDVSIAKNFAIMSIDLILENTGTSPAIGVFFEIQHVGRKNVKAFQSETIENMTRLSRDLPTTGFTVFPGKKFKINRVAICLLKDLDDDFLPDGTVAQHVIPYMAGCLVYHSSIGVRGETRFAFSITQTRESEWGYGQGFAIPKETAIIPKEYLSLSAYIEGSGAS